MATELEVTLQYRLEQVNGWLRFAEAKNGVLVALCGGLITAFNSYDMVAMASPLIKLSFWVGGSFVILATLVGLISFLPEYSRSETRETRRSQSADNLNLFFYGDIAKLTAQELLVSLYPGLTQETYNKTATDLADQLVRNSKIVLRKFSLFNVGAVCMLCASPFLFASLIFIQ